ncbi:hypothetical protein ACUOFC_47160, partial [Escherichia sp. TWPC-MK]
RRRSLNKFRSRFPGSRQVSCVTPHAIQREADRVVPENTGQSVGRVDYPDVFEQVWREYPLRAGANPKKSAFSAWKARLREGVPPEAMLDGVRRYARYLAATGKTGTEFVQRATT